MLGLKLCLIMLLFNLIYLMLSFQYLIHIKIISEILSSFFHTASSKFGMYFTLKSQFDLATFQVLKSHMWLVGGYCFEQHSISSYDL